MPDNNQARTDNMPNGPRSGNRWVSKVVIFGGAIALIAILALVAT